MTSECIGWFCVYLFAIVGISVKGFASMPLGTVYLILLCFCWFFTLCIYVCDVGEWMSVKHMGIHNFSFYIDMISLRKLTSHFAGITEATSLSCLASTVKNIHLYLISLGVVCSLVLLCNLNWFNGYEFVDLSVGNFSQNFCVLWIWSYTTFLNKDVFKTAYCGYISFIFFGLTFYFQITTVNEQRICWCTRIYAHQ